MRKINAVLNTVMGCTAGVFLGYGCYTVWNYHTRPELYSDAVRPLVYGHSPIRRRRRSDPAGRYRFEARNPQMREEITDLEENDIPGFDETKPGIFSVRRRSLSAAASSSSPAGPQRPT